MEGNSGPLGWPSLGVSQSGAETQTLSWVLELGSTLKWALWLNPEFLVSFTQMSWQFLPGQLSNPVEKMQRHQKIRLSSCGCQYWIQHIDTQKLSQIKIFELTDSLYTPYLKNQECLICLLPDNPSWKYLCHPVSLEPSYQAIIHTTRNIFKLYVNIPQAGFQYWRTALSSLVNCTSSPWAYRLLSSDCATGLLSL